MMFATLFVSYLAALLLVCLTAYAAGWLCGRVWSWMTRRERERLDQIFDRKLRR